MSNSETVRLRQCIPEADLKELVKYCFDNKIYGQFGCYNPHWWISVTDRWIYYYYQESPFEESKYDSWDQYETPEELFVDIISGGDDWWFKMEEE